MQSAFFPPINGSAYQKKYPNNITPIHLILFNGGAGGKGDVGTWDLAQGQNNYDLTCGCVVDDTLFVGGRECELTRWDLETREPSWKVLEPVSQPSFVSAMMKP